MEPSSKIKQQIHIYSRKQVINSDKYAFNTKSMNYSTHCVFINMTTSHYTLQIISAKSPYDFAETLLKSILSMFLT